MTATFLAAFMFPPPAACALGFARRDGARAGRATDGQKALRVKRADRHIVVAGETGDALARPVEERTELHEIAAGVERHCFHAGAVLRGVGAQARP